MTPKKYRWSKVYESAEEELVDFLASRGITAERHEIDSYDTHTLPKRATMSSIWGVEGTAIFLVNGVRFSIQPGDVLDIPPQAEATITTALSNFAWYEPTERP